MFLKTIRKARNKWRTYSRVTSNALSMMRMGKKQGNDAGPRLFVTIKDFHQGRYAFQVVKYFHSAGYSICFFNSNRFLLNLHQYDQYIFTIPEARIVDEAQVKKANEADLLLVINSGYTPSPDFKGKILTADFDFFSPADQHSIHLPYYIHPNMYESLEIVKKKPADRKGRILFYGSSDVSYDKDLINGYFKLFGRGEVFDLLNDSALPMNRPRSYESFVSMLNNDSDPHRIYFINGNDFRIPVDQWLATLRRFDFFLATPGMFMPVCHNIIEAMALGVIPILQYGSSFHPPLRDGVNCLAFDSAATLVQAMEQALKLSGKEVEELGKGVDGYFGEFIDPRNFKNRLMSIREQNIRLHINAEEYSLSKQELPLSK